jgi:hypothetical protein
MELYERQHADRLIETAATDFVGRAVHRCGGVDEALRRLREDPDGEGVWATRFVEAFVTEEMLDTPAASAFVLEAFPTRTVGPDGGGPVADVVGRLARQVLHDLIVARADQHLQQAQMWQGAG